MLHVLILDRPIIRISTLLIFLIISKALYCQNLLNYNSTSFCGGTDGNFQQVSEKIWTDSLENKYTLGETSGINSVTINFK